jgi:outer membrane protein TolC
MDLYRASEEQVRLARQQTAFDAEQMFHQLWAARNAVQVTDDAVALTQAYVQDLENLSEVGMASRADLMAAQVQLSSAKLDSMKARHGTHLLETMFKVQLGLPREETVELLMDDQLPINELPAERDEILVMALRNRPDLAGIDFTLDAMKHYSNAAWASWLPAVVLVGNLNAQNPDYSNEPNWLFTANATVALSWSIWDRGAALQNNRAAKASYHQLESQRQLLAEMMDVELEAAITSFDEAGAELELAVETVGHATESVRLEQERFEAGVSNNTQLLTSQTALKGSELAVLQAETQMRISYAALRKAVGFDPEVK